jgi:peptidyl-prolyl cis-trans isomerase C
MKSIPTRTMRRQILSAVSLTTCLGIGQGARAQWTPDVTASPAPVSDISKPVFNTTRHVFDPVPGADRSAATMVAEVDGRPVTLGQVGDAIRLLPPIMAASPFENLYPVVLEQLIGEQALAISAQNENLDEDPTISRRMRAAATRVLANEYLNRELLATITEHELLERFQRDVAGKPGPEEVRGRIIMVSTEQEALKVLAELQGGADFATVARRVSRDASAGVGGDLGFTARGVLNPELGAVLFALPVGQTAAYPVNALGSWYLVRTEERRRRTPVFSQVREELKVKMQRERATPFNAALLSTMKVRYFDLAGNEIALDKPAKR